MQNCLIWGAGASGVSAVKFLLTKEKNVYIYDIDRKKTRDLFAANIIDLRVHFVKKIDAKILDIVDTIVLSPGVKISPKIERKCIQQNIQIISEIDLAGMFCPAPIYAITGTNGKTTTVNFLHQILKFGQRESWLLGNVGTPFCAKVDDLHAKSAVVLELSSFQLERCPHLKCAAVAILNLAPDHLDRYSSFDDYVSAKAKILDCVKAGGRILLNMDDERVRELGAGRENVIFFSLNSLPVDAVGYFIKNGSIYHKTLHRTQKLLDLPHLGLLGEHNLQNLLCAVALAHLAKIQPAQIAAALSGLTLPRHRLELAGQKDGVSFYDDSKATNIAATRAALACFDKKIHLLLGGSDKGEDFECFLTHLPSAVFSVTAFGAMGKKIWKICKKHNILCEYYPTLTLAFDFVKYLAHSGEVVLLSPACASFDEFSDYQARGDYFCHLVTEWMCEK